MKLNQQRPRVASAQRGRLSLTRPTQPSFWNTLPCRKPPPWVRVPLRLTGLERRPEVLGRSAQQCGRMQGRKSMPFACSGPSRLQHAHLRTTLVRRFQRCISSSLILPVRAKGRSGLWWPLCCPERQGPFRHHEPTTRHARHGRLPVLYGTTTAYQIHLCLCAGRSRSVRSDSRPT